MDDNTSLVIFTALIVLAVILTKLIRTWGDRKDYETEAARTLADAELVRAETEAKRAKDHRVTTRSIQPDPNNLPDQIRKEADKLV